MQYTIPLIGPADNSFILAVTTDRETHIRAEWEVEGDMAVVISRAVIDCIRVAGTTDVTVEITVMPA